MPLKAGYSIKVVAENAALMQREGRPYDQAIAASLENARVSYFKKFPQGFLPSHLRLPGGRRDRAAWNAAKKGGKRAPNPVPMSKRVQVREAARLYEDFSGHDAEEIATIDKPEFPDVVLVIGTLDFVGYTATRDGVDEKYIHEFKDTCRPLLCASPDGKQLVLLGGEYTFTERGIVDGR